MNVRYRVTLTQYERDELDGLLSGGKRRGSSSGLRSCWPRTRGSAMRISL
jgi:hypothetical protein